MKTIQWVHSKLVNPATIESLDGPNPFTWCSATFPYTIPEKTWLGIVDAQIGTKFSMNGRASYLVVSNVLALPDAVGHAHFRIPVVIPPGVTITAQLINNDTEAQWMGSIVTGLLVPQIDGQSWQEAFVSFARI